ELLLLRGINERHMVGIGAERPTAGEEGRTYLTTDSTPVKFEVDDGTNWQLLPIWAVPLTAILGGTGFSSYAIGDLLAADTTTTLSKIADVAAGKYFRSGGIGVLPLWSTLTLPNTAVVGDIPYASATDVISLLADVAAGAYLRSGGVTTAPLWSTLLLPNAGTVGDLPYVSATNVVSMLADVAAGAYLRSGGIGVAPLWSTLLMPNAGTVGDVPYVSATNVVSMLADVAAGKYLRSGGVTTAPVWSTLTLPNSGTTGDIAAVTSTNVVGAIAAVAIGQHLRSAGTGTLPVWRAMTTSQTDPGDPTGTNNITGVMMGLAGTITPTDSGKVFLSISGSLSIPGGVAGEIAHVQLRYGTGTAPTNGDALTGTTAGGLIRYVASTTSGEVPFASQALVTGLSVATAYWLDVSLQTTSLALASFEAFRLTAVEVLGLIWP
ncbi:MAG: hypothetical protein Q8R28_15685, partial [Dehalococcoidia bacterium]|nr:hypothetical protein [Dehalococcoidia bacterium]